MSGHIPAEEAAEMFWRNDLWWVRYTLPNGRHVYLTNRPDMCTPESVKEFVETIRPGIRFQLTDDAMRGNHELIEKVPYHWNVWSPCASLKPEVVWPFLSVMDWFNRTQPADVPAWIHCDSSSMRAPTFFGLWLRCVYRDQLEAIQDTAMQSGDRRLSSLVRYSAVSMERDPGISQMIEGWVQGGEEKAHSAMLRWTEENSRGKNEG